MPLLAQRLKPRSTTRIVPTDPSLTATQPAAHTPTKRTRTRSLTPDTDAGGDDDNRAPSPPPRAPSHRRQMSPPSTPSKLTRTASTPTRAGESRRSTRSTGKADHFQPLEGAPVTPRSAGRGPRARRAVSLKKFVREVDGSSSSEDEVEVVVTRTRGRAASSSRRAKPARAPPKKRVKVEEDEDDAPAPPEKTRATKRAQRPPSPDPTSSSSSSDDDEADDTASSTSANEVKEMLVSTPPPRKRATRTVDLDLPPSPAKTPTKVRQAYTPKVPSPLKPRPRREASEFDMDMDADTLSAADSRDERDSLISTSPSSSSSIRREPSSATSTPLTTPTSRRSTSSSSIGTPSRSSSRIRHLPPSLKEIANAPAALRNRLVGFHMEDEGYGREVGVREAEEEEEGSEDEDENENERKKGRRDKGKERMMEEADGDDGGLRDEDDDEDEGMEISQPAFAPARLATSTSATAAHPLIPTVPNASYLSSSLRAHVLSLLSVLSGSRLPGPLPSPSAKHPPPDSILSLPYLEGGYDEWERPLRASLEECVTKGMGNAVMLLGPRGVGKTMLIDRTLALLSHAHGPEAFVTVRLSGLVHTTDRLAMRSIAVQLREQGFGDAAQVEGEAEGDYSSNSATMSTLLRLLEPSSSTSTASTNSSSTHAPTSTRSKPLVLVVDEFDLFAQHPRQSFLYCLLDIVQGNRRRGGVAVVGVSSRVDCLSLLEKRVRSRCQSHVLQLIPPSSFSAFTDLAKRLLRADEHVWEEKRGQEGREWAETWNAEVERFLKEKKVVDYLTRMWQIHGNVPTELRSSLAHLLYRVDYLGRLNGVSDSKDVPRLSVDMLKPQPKGEDKSRDEVLKHLSIPELTVLIACKHLSTSTLDRHAGFNFEQVYDAYLSHSRRVSASTASALAMSTKPLSKPAMRAAFDSLREHELLLPRTSSGSAGSSNGGAATTSGSGMPVSVPSLAYKSPTARDPWKMYRLTTWARDVDREVEARGGECPLALRRWCKNWLD